MSCADRCDLRDMTIQVSIEDLTETKTQQGAVSESWASAAIRFGKIEQLAGRELVDAQKVKSVTTHRVKMRYYDVQPEQRLSFTDPQSGSTVNLGVLWVDQGGYDGVYTTVYCHEAK